MSESDKRLGKVLVKDLTEEEKEIYDIMRRQSKKVFLGFLFQDDDYLKLNANAFNAALGQKTYYDLRLAAPIQGQVGYQNDMGIVLKKLFDSEYVSDFNKIRMINDLRYYTAFIDRIHHIEDLVWRLRDELGKNSPHLILILAIENEDVDTILKFSKGNTYLWSHQSRDLLVKQSPEFILDCVKAKPKGSYELGLRLNVLKHPTESQLKDPIYREIAKIIVENNPKAVSFLNHTWIEDNSYVKVCELSGLALSFIPKKRITQEMCDAAVLKAASALKYVPEEFYNKGIIMKQLIKGSCIKKYVKDVKTSDTKAAKET